MANSSFSPMLVAFYRSALATMVSQRMQTIIALLLKYSPSHIMTHISVDHKWHFKVRQAQNRWAM